MVHWPISRLDLSQLIMQRRNITVICIVSLLCALVFIWLNFHPSIPKVDRKPMVGTASGIGLVLAEETLKLIPANGRIVLVTDYDHSQARQRQDYRWEMFQDEIKKHSGITIAATEIVESDPNEPMVSGCPSAAFKAILERQASASAIVFFIDLPDWSKVAGLIPQAVGPKIIAVDNLGEPNKPRYGGYFTSGVLSVLIGAHSAPAATTMVQPKTSREWFDKYHQVYTPQNFDTLAE